MWELKTTICYVRYGTTCMIAYEFTEALVWEEEESLHNFYANDF